MSTKGGGGGGRQNPCPLRKSKFLDGSHLVHLYFFWSWRAMHGMRAVYTVLLNELHRGLGEELLDKDLGADPGAENDSGGVPYKKSIVMLMEN